MLSGGASAAASTAAASAPAADDSSAADSAAAAAASAVAAAAATAAVSDAMDARPERGSRFCVFDKKFGGTRRRQRREAGGARTGAGEGGRRGGDGVSELGWLSEDGKVFGLASRIIGVVVVWLEIENVTVKGFGFGSISLGVVPPM